MPALVFGALVGKDFRLGEYLPLLFATVVIIVGSGVAGWLVARAADRHQDAGADDVQQLRQSRPAAGGARLRRVGAGAGGGDVRGVERDPLLLRCLGCWTTIPS